MGLCSVQRPRPRISLLKEGKKDNCDAQMLVSACTYLKCVAGEEERKRTTVHFLPVPAIIISSELSPFFFFPGTLAALWLLLKKKNIKRSNLSCVINQKSQLSFILLF